MLKTALKVFDKDLTSKGRDLPDLKIHKDPKERAPRLDKRKHTLEEAKPKKVINKEEEPNLRKTVLKKSALGSRDVVLEHWKRRVPVGPPNIDDIQLIDEISVSPRGEELHYFLVRTEPDILTNASFEKQFEAKAYLNHLKDNNGNTGQFVRVATASNHVALPNPAQDATEDKDMAVRDQAISDLDSWLITMGEGQRDFEDLSGM